MIISSQIRAARAFLKWHASTLAKAAGVSLPTIQRMEVGNGIPRSNSQTLHAVISALEKAGIEFTPESETAGPGVRLRKTDPTP